MRRSFATVSIVLLLLSARALPQQPTLSTTGAIEGNVVRVDNGEPVAGAQVMLDSVFPFIRRRELSMRCPSFQRR